MDSEEILHMNHLLEVEALSFQMQLKDAVSNFTNTQLLVITHDFLPATVENPLLNHPLFLQGFSDTSLTVGKAVAVLTNYERRTGETLSHSDLQHENLASKLKPEDYDLKGQVLLHL